MPDSFLAFDEANSYLNQQQRSLDYLDRIKILSVVGRTSIDLKNTNGYNRAVYIDKLNHLNKLPTTSIALTKSALKEHAGKPMNLADFTDLANSFNSDDDSMQVSVASQPGILLVEPQGLAGIVHQWRNQSSIINGAWEVPIVPNDMKFVNTSLESDNIWKSEDFKIYSDNLDDAKREIEQAKQLLSELGQGNTARFVSTTTTTTLPEEGR